MKLVLIFSLVVVFSISQAAGHRSPEVIQKQREQALTIAGKAPGMHWEPIRLPAAGSLLRELPKLLSDANPWRCEEIERSLPKNAKATSASDGNVRQVALAKLRAEAKKSPQWKTEYDMDLLGHRAMAERALKNRDLVEIDRLANYFRGSDTLQSVPENAPKGFVPEKLSDLLLRAIIHASLDQGLSSAASFYFDGWLDDNRADLLACKKQALGSLRLGLYLYTVTERAAGLKQLQEIFTHCGQTPPVIPSGTGDGVAETWFTSRQNAVGAVWLRRAVTFSGNTEEFAKYVTPPGDEPLPFCMAYHPSLFLETIKAASLAEKNGFSSAWRERLVDHLAHSTLKGEPWALDHLLEVMRSRNISVRLKAASVLGSVGPSVVPSVVKLFEEGETTSDCLFNILSEAGPAGTKALTSFIGKEKTSFAQMELIKALGRAGDFENPKTLQYLMESVDDKDASVSDAARDALNALPKAGLEKLMAFTEKKLSSDQMITLAQSLDELGAPAVPWLFSLIHSADGNVRGQALSSLARIRAGKDLEVVKKLLALIDSKEKDVPREAIYALSTAGPAALPLVAERMKRPMAEGNEVALIQMLGQYGKEAIPLVLTRVKAPSTEVRKTAIRTLLHMDPQESASAKSALLGALEDKDPDVSATAASVLKAMGKVPPEPLLALVGKPHVSREALAAVLSAAGEKGVAPLLELAKSPDPKVREYAIESLAELSAFANRKVVTTLLAEISRPEEPSLYEAYEALSKMGRHLTPEERNSFVKRLLSHSADQDPGLQHKASSALGQLGSEATPAILTALNEASSTDREFFAEALLGHGADAIPALVKIAGDGNSVLAGNALASLRENQSTAEAGRELVGLYFSNPVLKDDVRMYVGEEPQTFLPFVEQRLTNPEFRAKSLELLGDLKKKAVSSVPRILSHLIDGDQKIRNAAGEAIFKIGKSSGAAFTEGLKHPNDRVFSAVARIALDAKLSPEKPQQEILLREIQSTSQARSRTATPLLAIRSEAVVSELASLINSSDLQVRLNAVKALRGAGKDALPALARAQGDSHPEIAQAARESAEAILGK